MKYVVEFEDKPCCDKPDLYRMKHTNSVYISRETLEKFPKYEEPATSAKMSENDSERLRDLENLKEGDVVIAMNGDSDIRMGLVVFVYSEKEKSYKIVSKYGVVMRRSPKYLFELGYHKSITTYTTEEFFSKHKSKAAEEEIRDEAAEELSNLQPGDVIYKYVGEEKLLRRMVNYVYSDNDYEFINESGWKFRCSLQSLIFEGWRKVKDDLTTREFYWKLRGGGTL